MGRTMFRTDDLAPPLVPIAERLSDTPDDAGGEQESTGPSP